MNRSSFFYINWMKDAKLFNISTTEFAEKCQLFKEKSKEKEGSKTVKREWFEAAKDTGDAYMIERVGNYLRLLTFSFEKGWVVFSTNTFDESKNEKKIYKPTVAFSKFRSEFAKMHESKDANFFSRTFGSTPEAFFITIMKPIYYFNSFYEGKRIKCGSIDRSSAYPADACGYLPDAKTAIIIEGYAEPTEEYPFAFYMKSGHIAEFGKFNSREWLDLPIELNIYKFKDGRDKPSYYIQKENDETVLMKPAKYKLDDLWEKYYERKENSKSEAERSFAKSVLVSIIGCWHMKNTMRGYQYKYAHLAAIVIARANFECIQKMKKIGFSRCVHVIVDGISYAGEDEQGIDEKRLGKWKNEAVGAQGYFKGINYYMIKKNQEVIKARHSGYNFFKDGNPIYESMLKNFEDMDNIKRM